MKRLALFLDGTWNDPEDKTSVYRLAGNVVTTEANDPVQRVYYGQGVGTRWYDKLRGGVLGQGLYENLQAAYGWLLKHYDEGDQVYIFGFSRGAYTARSLAGLIAKCGLIERDAGQALTLAQIYARYQKGKGADPIYTLHRISKENSRILSPEESALLKHSRRIPIEMIGVWDTVGSLGVPWTSAPLLGRENFYFHNTNPSRLYRHAFQALALDEHRGPYEPTLWTDFTPDKPDPIPEKPWTREQLEQRWFIGAHSDVGGGYKGGTLDRLPMAWLQGKAAQLGLQFKNQVQLDGTEIAQVPTDSFAQFLKGAYRAIRLGKRFFRPIGRGVQKVTGGTSTPINEVIDGSVFDRWRKYSEYRRRTWPTGQHDQGEGWTQS
jgi:uncharacterized protein (DUF2235 family)